MANTIKTIVVQGGYTLVELKAAVAVTPGMLVEQTSAAVDSCQPHHTKGGPAEKMFATEDGLQGDEITDAYSVGDIVFCAIFERGSVVNAIANAAITKGDFVESAGNGYVRTHDPDDSSYGKLYNSNILGKALEAATASGDRIKVRLI